MTSKMELFNLLFNQNLSDSAILILANKQDLPGAKAAEEIS